jgi:hypothetical protein
MERNIYSAGCRGFVLLLVLALCPISRSFASNEGADSNRYLASVDEFNRRLMKECLAVGMALRYCGSFNTSVVGMEPNYKSGVWELYNARLHGGGELIPQGNLLKVKLVKSSDPGITIRVKGILLHFLFLDSEEKSVAKKSLQNSDKTYESLLRSADDNVWRDGGTTAPKLP